MPKIFKRFFYFCLLAALLAASGVANANQWLSLDEATGQGVYVWDNGDRYEGKVFNRKLHGQGVLTWPSGERYEGEFQNDMRHGHGVFTFSDGQRYEGKYENGNMRQGVMTWPSGERYEGEFQNDTLHGHGMYNCPVNMVSWHDAHEFIQKLNTKTGINYRLPSEAEWEYSARAGTTTAYYWGENASHQYANYGTADCCGLSARGRDKWEYSSPVASFPPNAFGLYDMSGNVYKWVKDKFHNDYEGAPDDGSAWTEKESDYTQDGKCRYTYFGGECALGGHDLVIIRGGSLSSYDELIRSGKRVSEDTEQRYLFLGFRVARSLP